MEDLVVGEDLILDLGLPSSLYKLLILEAGYKWVKTIMSWDLDALLSLKTLTDTLPKSH